MRFMFDLLKSFIHISNEISVINFGNIKVEIVGQFINEKG